MFLLRDEGYIVPKIRSIANHHANNIPKWIHRLNEKDIDNTTSRKHIRNAHKITEEMHLMVEESITKILYMVITRACRIHNRKKEDHIQNISHTEVKNVLV